MDSKSGASIIKRRFSTRDVFGILIALAMGLLSLVSWQVFFHGYSQSRYPQYCDGFVLVFFTGFGFFPGDSGLEGAVYAADSSSPCFSAEFFVCTELVSFHLCRYCSHARVSVDSFRAG